MGRVAPGSVRLIGRSVSAVSGAARRLTIWAADPFTPSLQLRIFDEALIVPSEATLVVVAPKPKDSALRCPSSCSQST